MLGGSVQLRPQFVREMVGWNHGGHPAMTLASAWRRREAVPKLWQSIKWGCDGTMRVALSNRQGSHLQHEHDVTGRGNYVEYFIIITIIITTDMADTNGPFIGAISLCFSARSTFWERAILIAAAGFVTGDLL
jgi:hypothetical protein